MEKFYANALLKDGKIMFWWSGDMCHSVYDFYKDFYYAHMNMEEEFATGKYSLVSKPISTIGSSEEELFYRQFEIHEESKGRPPYQADVTPIIGRNLIGSWKGLRNNESISCM